MLNTTVNTNGITNNNVCGSENDPQALYSSLEAKISKRSQFAVRHLRKAFEFANTSHLNQKRNSGEPYICHPLSVAHILADLNFESDIVIAAILHDVIEDSEAEPIVSTKKIQSLFGSRIAEIVSAVTNIERDANAYHLDKEERKDESIKKLFKTYSEYGDTFAFIVKLADRVHNLKTLNTGDPNKIKGKIKETQAYYVDGCRYFGIHYFEDLIEDLLFKLEDACDNTLNKKYKQIQNSYDGYIQQRNRAFREGYFFNTYETIRRMSRSISDSIRLMGYDDFEVRVEESYYSPFQILRNVENTFDYDKDLLIQMHNNKKMTIFDINVICISQHESPFSLFRKLLFDKYQDDLFFKKGIMFKEISIDENNRLIITIEDTIKYRYRLIVTTLSDQHNYEFGVQDIVVSNNSIKNILDSYKQQIVVYSDTNEKFQVPKGAVALDFAFQIHEDVGLCAKEALINEKKQSLFTELNNGDKVEIIKTTGVVNGILTEFKCNVAINWLYHAKTEFARRLILKQLEMMYGTVPNDTPSELEVIKASLSQASKSLLLQGD